MGCGIGVGKDCKMVMNTKLHAFLYILLKDHLPAGVVEKIMINHVEYIAGSPFCSKHLSSYASELAERLTKETR